MTDYRIDGTKLDLHPERVAAWMRGEKIYPLYLEIAPSGGCPHRCTFCATKFISNYDSRLSLGADLLKVRLAEMARLGVKSVMAGGSGEPLMHPRLGEVIVAARQAGLDCAITTNGQAMKERFCREALSSLAWIKVSINAGTEEAYRAIHQAGPKDWRRLWGNLSDAIKIRQELGAPVTIGAQCVVLPDNAPTVTALIKRACDLGLDYVVLKPYSHQAKTPTPYAGLEYEQYRKLFHRSEAMSTDTFKVIARWSASVQVTAEDRGYERCLSTGNMWAYLEADWNLYSCSAYVNDARFCLGNLREQTFEEVWTSPRAREHAKWVNEEMDCSVCRRGCRMDSSNRHLWRLKNPQRHDRFV